MRRQIFDVLRLIKRLRNVYAVNYCPVYICWKPFLKRTPIQRIHRTASQHQFCPYPWPFRAALKSLMLLWWPIRVLILIPRYTRRFGPTVKSRNGKGMTRQMLEQLGLALGLFIAPVEYYRYAFYESRRRAQAADYLQNHERTGLGLGLNQRPTHVAIDDKMQFAQMCAQHGIATVPVFAVAHRDGIRDLSAQLISTLPAADLFLKPVRGVRGEGSEQLRWTHSNQYQRHDGALLSPTELMAYLHRLGRERAYLVQPCLTNHPDLADFTNGALSTARIVTGRMPDETIVLIAATFKMPFGQGITSTYGLHSAIELDSGVLGKAYRYAPLCLGFDVHPDTGGQITGRVLPAWSQAVTLSQKAHEVFAEYVFLGWDIAWTPDGPVVLEGNAGWDVPTVQLPQRQPLGQTRFVEVCLAHMR